ncbi:MAG: acyl-CoA carboxylase subunit beta [Chloroflexota bacterium]
MDSIMKSKIDEYRARRKKFLRGGTEQSIARQRSAGKLLARERVELLLDPGSLVEYDLFVDRHTSDFGLGGVEAPTEGFVTGVGKVEGRPVAVCAQDFTILGGSVGLWGSRKMMKIAELALTYRIPLVMLNDSGGARPQEQHEARAEGYTALFHFHSIASGVIPQLSLIMGPVAGGPCYAPAITDFIVMVKKTSSMFIAGPPVVKAITGEEVSAEELGGTSIHGPVSGTADVIADDDRQCLTTARDLLGYLPSNNQEPAPHADPGDDPERRAPELADIVPGDVNKPYDMHKVIEKIADKGVFLELKPAYAGNLLTGFARFNGHPVGILANQPQVMAGVIDWKAAWKGARFVRFCDAFNIPMLHLVDTPAYLVGTQSERQGIIRHGAQFLFAESEATVPVITVILRKAYAGAGSVMGSRHLKVSDYIVAWPSAEVALFGGEAGLSVLLRSKRLRDQLSKAENQDALLQAWKEEYQSKYVDLYSVAPVRYVDDIIDPETTRPVIIKALELLRNRKKQLPWKKHGNMPL